MVISRHGRFKKESSCRVAPAAAADFTLFFFFLRRMRSLSAWWSERKGHRRHVRTDDILQHVLTSAFFFPLFFVKRTLYDNGYAPVHIH
jgi:hypothetical protein